MRAGRSERDAERVREGQELDAALGEPRRRFREALAATRADLDLGRDQLAGEVRLERRPLRRRLEVLEAPDETERRRVEDGELLLDRDRQVGPFLELLAERA